MVGMSTNVAINVERVCIEEPPWRDVCYPPLCACPIARGAHCERSAELARAAAAAAGLPCFLRRREQRSDAPALDLFHAEDADKELDRIRLRLEADGEGQRHVDIGRAIIHLDDGGVGEIGIDAPNLGELILGHPFDERVRSPEGHTVVTQRNSGVSTRNVLTLTRSRAFCAAAN